MTRFLGLLILILHTLSDIRRKITLRITASCLMITAMLIVAGTVSADANSAHSDTTRVTQQQSKVAQPQNVHSVPLFVSKGQAISRLRTIQKVIPATVSSSAHMAGKSLDTTRGTDAPPNSTPSPSQSTSGTSSFSQEPYSIEVIQGDAGCVEGQPALTITTARLLAQKATPADVSISWYWELRIDSNTSSMQSPIDSSQKNQTMPAGQISLSFVNVDNSQPLLTAPESASNAYSFRLHIVAPFDAVSTWINVPQASDVSCQDQPAVN